jgi:release factor glutamine methyltransferase
LSKTVQDALLDATRALGTTMPYHDARLQAELLLAHALETTRALVLARLHETFAPEIAARYAANVARRAQHEPLAYILGHQEFYGLDFLVDRRVLIPRHETATLAQLALERVVVETAPTNVPSRPVSAQSVCEGRLGAVVDANSFARLDAPVIVDVGTGSGAVALTLAYHLPHARVIATDVSHDALDVARLNAHRLNLEPCVAFVEGDLLERVSEPWDILVANLPYIPSVRYEQLPREIRAFEPRRALDGGKDGLDVFRRLLTQLGSHASRGATALLEISEEQGAAAVECVQSALPRALATLHRDLEGFDRVVEIQRIKSEG